MSPAASWGVARTGESPAIVLHVPHAGLEVPADVRADIVLDDAALNAELAAMTDRHTDHLALAAREAAGVDAIAFLNRLSRFVVDPERLPDDDEPMAARGMGRVYRATSTLGVLRRADPDREAALVEQYLEPYAAAFAAVVGEVIEARGEVTIVDVHSYPCAPLPYEDDPSADRPGLCVGTDRTHTSAWLSGAVEAAFDGVRGGVACDTPFAGTYVPLDRYGSDPRCRSVMVEIRRDLYMDEHTLELHDGAADVIRRLADLLRVIAAA